MSDELISIPTADGDMPGHLWRPDSGSGPGILLLQEIFGISDYIVSRAGDLVDLGYVVLAPEIYWRIGPPGWRTGRTHSTRPSGWRSASTGTSP